MNTVISTPCGEIKGSAADGVIAFKGIRYATAERWAYPVITEKWNGVYDATSYGNCSYQPRAFYNEEENPGKIFYYNEFRKGETYTYDEDCLFLNIWTPEDASESSRMPVLVYIHGGGFTGGCGHEKHFDGPVWAKKGVVAVTINYRLGPMGFACLPELKEEAGHTGNYGLFDQIAALKWVKKNISAFGGDGEKITVMGQSAGAMSVQHLCQSDLTDGLFRSAVMSSGVGMGSFMTSAPEKNYEFWKEVMAKTGAANLSEFRKISPEVLFREWKNLKGGMMSASPVKDGILIKEKALPKNIPYMIGSTSHDIAPAFLHPMTRKWGTKNGAYVWHFERMLPGDDKGAWHSSDLWYWFGTLKNCWRPMTDKDYTLSDEMSSYLCSFVKNGNPNTDGLPYWQKCNSKKDVMIFGDKDTSAGKPDMAKLIKITLTNKPVGE
ncbi:MAG: carboxylesterase family protein [Clostridia bacterium]|nr:carboxylesterase family protein [Clostridia bacterium]MBQ5904553.1 carboxylesterase family protein [Clostridia bacterium]